MKTNIPHTEYIRIRQIKLSAEIIASLLNEAEEKYSPMPRHWNAKRTYPFWKTCETCQKPYPTYTKEQALRNKICSQECLGVRFAEARIGIPLGRRAEWMKLNCAYCKKPIEVRKKQMKYSKRKYCSKTCRAKHVTAPILTANKFDRTGMKFPGTGLKGAANPAWKGGVTYFKKHGNYAGIKYVRCPQEFLVMARKDGYVMEHRLIMAQHMGRPLLRTEVVHHINHDPTDNRIENLRLFKTNKAHKLHEAQERKLPQ